jgi:hypothetical protein
MLEYRLSWLKFFVVFLRFCNLMPGNFTPASASHYSRLLSRIIIPSDTLLSQLLTWSWTAVIIESSASFVGCSTFLFPTLVDFTCSVLDNTTRLLNTLIHRPTPHKVQQNQNPLDFISTDYNISDNYVRLCRSQWPRRVRRRSAGGRSPAEIVVSNPTRGMEYRECCVLSGRGLCDELITRPEESYRMWCVVVCDLQTSWMRRPWPTEGYCSKGLRRMISMILVL